MNILYKLMMIIGAFINELLVPTPRAIIATIVTLIIIYTIVFISCRIDGLREEKRKATRKWWHDINKNL